MAHFAELDENNVVKRVVVVGNDIPTSNGPLGENDMHVDGEKWCQNFFKGGTWKQTSYNANFRKHYGGLGFTYDSEKDIFISPQPYSSWTLNANNDWQAPLTKPSIVDDGQDPIVWEYLISWNEEKYQANNNTGWEARKSNDHAVGGFSGKTVYNWNGTAWVSE
jgi:hypothetical protein